MLNNSVLVALNDSVSSRAVLNYIIEFFYPCFNTIHITLTHIFIKPAAGDELMGKGFLKKQSERVCRLLDSAKTKLVESGLPPDNVNLKLISEPWDTVADGIIDQFRKGNYNLVVIGRKKMSKAEEFVRGDPSIRLLRALEKTAVLVVMTDK